MENEEAKFFWNEESTDALLYFVENVSGPWHPSQWAVLIELVSQIKNWEGQQMPAVSPNKSKRVHLHISPMMKAFIMALNEADYFLNINEFYDFLNNVQSDEVFSMYRYWMRLDCPLNKDDEYFLEFQQQLVEYKDNLTNLNDSIASYSDEEIAKELEVLKRSIEEE
tara:strand:- start:198 stop:698 length:501 start_codon:yes stop_codon:yes gene_type:complete